MKIFETERLLARTWSVDDVKFASELWGDSEVMTFIDVRGGLNQNQIIEKLKMESDCQEKNGVQYWPLFEKQTGEFVGCSGLKPWVHSSRGGFELGFHIIKAKWGRGYAKEAAAGVVNWAFQVKKQTYLMAGHHPGNLNSKKILLSLGFQFVEDVYFKPTGLMHLSYVLEN